MPFDVAVEEPDAWKANVSLVLQRGRRTRGMGREDLSGLSARKRMTMLPLGRTIKVSRRIGVAGRVSLAT